MSKDAKLVLPADGSIQKTIAGARAADKGPEYYVVLRYAAGSTTLEVASEGAGGWDAAAAHLPPADGAYVFLRKDLKVEMAKTVKFAYIEWFPEGLKAMRRIALSALKKPASDLLKPYHVELAANELKDVNQKLVDDRINAVSGVAVHERSRPSVAAAPAAESAAAAPAADAAAAPAPEAKKPEAKAAPKPSPAKPVASVAAGGSGGIKFVDAAAFTDAIKAIRNDKNDTNWVTASYSDRDTLNLTGSGADGFAGLQGKLDADGISFGLLRVTEMIDGKSKTTKFVFIKSIPDTVKPMKKAEITTRAGAIEKVFGQFHVQFDISKATEISEQIVMDKVGNASGAKSNVKDK